MIQPTTLNAREAAGDKKTSTYRNCDVLRLGCSCWCYEVDDESFVVDEAWSGGEVMLRRNWCSRCSCSCCCCRSLGVFFFERGLHLVLSQLALITTTLFRPSEELFHFRTDSTAALNLHVKTHFLCFDILHWTQNTFFVYWLFVRSRRDLIFNITFFEPSCIFHH